MLDSSEPGVEFISILSFVPFSNCEIIRGDQKLLGPKLELGRGSLQKCQPRGCLNYNQKMGREGKNGGTKEKVVGLPRAYWVAENA